MSEEKSTFDVDSLRTADLCSDRSGLETLRRRTQSVDTRLKSLVLENQGLRHQIQVARENESLRSVTVISTLLSWIDKNTGDQEEVTLQAEENINKGNIDNVKQSPWGRGASESSEQQVPTCRICTSNKEDSVIPVSPLAKSSPRDKDKGENKSLGGSGLPGQSDRGDRRYERLILNTTDKSKLQGKSQTIRDRSSKGGDQASKRGTESSFVPADRFDFGAVSSTRSKKAEDSDRQSQFDQWKKQLTSAYIIKDRGSVETPRDALGFEQTSTRTTPSLSLPHASSSKDQDDSTTMRMNDTQPELDSAALNLTLVRGGDIQERYAPPTRVRRYSITQGLDGRETQVVNMASGATGSNSDASLPETEGTGDEDEENISRPAGYVWQKRAHPAAPGIGAPLAASTPTGRQYNRGLDDRRMASKERLIVIQGAGEEGQDEEERPKSHVDQDFQFLQQQLTGRYQDQMQGQSPRSQQESSFRTPPVRRTLPQSATAQSDIPEPSRRPAAQPAQKSMPQSQTTAGYTTLRGQPATVPYPTLHDDMYAVPQTAQQYTEPKKPPAAHPTGSLIRQDDGVLIYPSSHPQTKTRDDAAPRKNVAVAGYERSGRTRGPIGKFVGEPVAKPVPEQTARSQGYTIEKDFRQGKTAADFQSGLQNEADLRAAKTRVTQPTDTKSTDDVQPRVQTQLFRDRPASGRRERYLNKRDTIWAQDSDGNWYEAAAGKTKEASAEARPGPRDTDVEESRRAGFVRALSHIKAPTRLIGEIAFQLDRRILNSVFNTAKASKEKKRFYGYTIANMEEKMTRESINPATGMLDTGVYGPIRMRYDNLLSNLSVLGYDISRHAVVAADLVNKYGLLPLPPKGDDTKHFKAHNRDLFEEVLVRITPAHEMRDVKIMLNCLSWLASTDEKPMVAW